MQNLIRRGEEALTDEERLLKIEKLTEENRINLMAFLDLLIALQDKHQSGCGSQE